MCAVERNIWTESSPIGTAASEGIVFAIPVDTMPSLAAVPMGDDSVHMFLSTAHIYQVPMSPAWMGCYLASCENVRGQLVKIVISVYGGFFLNEFDGKYYHIDRGLTPFWLDYMRRSYIKTE